MLMRLSKARRLAVTVVVSALCLAVVTPFYCKLLSCSPDSMVAEKVQLSAHTEECRAEAGACAHCSNYTEADGCPETYQVTQAALPVERPHPDAAKVYVVHSLALHGDSEITRDQSISSLYQTRAPSSVHASPIYILDCSFLC